MEFSWWVIIVYVAVFAVMIAVIFTIIRFLKNALIGRNERRSIRVCPKCGNRVSGNYCSNCGEKLW